MLEKLNEPIDVLVKFNRDKENCRHLVAPTHFKWQDRTYEIEKVNLVHKRRDGNDMVYYFSVSDSANHFRLAFFTRDLSWRIEELFSE